MIENLKNEIWHFVKRQRTWFKRNENIKWFEPKNQKEIVYYVKAKL